MLEYLVYSWYKKVYRQWCYIKKQQKKLMGLEPMLNNKATEATVISSYQVYQQYSITCNSGQLSPHDLIHVIAGWPPT